MEWVLWHRTKPQIPLLGRNNSFTLKTFIGCVIKGLGLFIYGFWKTAHGLWFGLKDAFCLHDAGRISDIQGCVGCVVVGFGMLRISGLCRGVFAPVKAAVLGRVWNVAADCGRKTQQLRL